MFKFVYLCFQGLIYGVCLRSDSFLKRLRALSLRVYSQRSAPNFILSHEVLSDQAPKFTLFDCLFDSLFSRVSDWQVKVEHQNFLTFSHQLIKRKCI